MTRPLGGLQSRRLGGTRSEAVSVCDKHLRHRQALIRSVSASSKGAARNESLMALSNHSQHPDVECGEPTRLVEEIRAGTQRPSCREGGCRNAACRIIHGVDPFVVSEVFDGDHSGMRNQPGRAFALYMNR